MDDEQLMTLKNSIDMLTTATIVNAAYTARLIEIQSGKFDQEKISPLISETDDLVRCIHRLNYVRDICEANEAPD